MKIFLVLLMGAFAVLLAMDIYRDIQADRQNPPDLRNRVVGARLIKEGKSPYFYKWKAADGVRYYDPSAFDSLSFSNITATPFFHQLIAPLAAIPQRQFSRLWLLIQYIMLLTTAILFFIAAPDNIRKGLVMAVTAFFLLTEGWKMNIQNGQNYLFIPFFATLFYFILRQQKKPGWAFAAGSIAVCLVLIRPNCIFFFVPFLLLVKDFPRNYLLALFTPLLLLFGWLLLSSQERFLWNDYRRQVTLQIKMHQGMPTPLQHNEMDPGYANWEGLDSSVLNKEMREHPFYQHSENGNFFVIINRTFNTKLSLTAINLMSAISLLLLAGAFYYRKWNESPGIEEIAIMGFCLYMLSDLFSPVYRHQYYTVQWMFPVFLALSYFRPSWKWSYLFVWAGLLLNCVNLGFMKMEHTIGEYIWLLCLIALSLTLKTKQPV